MPDTLEMQEDTNTETTETEDTFVQSFDLVEDFRSFFDNSKFNYTGFIKQSIYKL